MSIARGSAYSSVRRRASQYHAPQDRADYLADLEQRGIAHRQTFSPEMYQLALERGESPDDPASLLSPGPSDNQARDYWRQRREQETKLANTKRRKKR